MDSEYILSGENSFFCGEIIDIAKKITDNIKPLKSVREMKINYTEQGAAEKVRGYIKRIYEYEYGVYCEAAKLSQNKAILNLVQARINNLTSLDVEFIRYEEENKKPLPNPYNRDYE